MPFADEAGAWLVGMINESGYEQVERIAEGMINEWVELDQEKPFEYVERIRDPEIRSKVLREVIEELASEDPAAAAWRLAI